jgi:hypothetical protein
VYELMLHFAKSFKFESIVEDKKSHICPPLELVYHPSKTYPSLVGWAGSIIWSPLLIYWLLGVFLAPK